MLELVENAVMMELRMRLKNTSGLRPPSTRTSTDSDPTPWSSNPISTTATNAPSFFRMSNPRCQVTTKIRPNTP